MEKYLKYGVAQGSFGGPILYEAYTSTLEYLVDPDVGLDVNRFADDHSVNKGFNPNREEEESLTKSLIESSLVNINTWMHVNHLKMNTSEMEFIYYGSRPQLAKCVCDCINICGYIVLRSDIIKLHGAWLDSHPNYKTHISNKCHTTMFNLQRIKYIHKYLTKDAGQTLVHGLVMSNLDYINSF